VIDGKLHLKHVPTSKRVTLTRLINIKNVRIADQQKASARKQGRDDSIKQCIEKICRTELCTELIYARLFADLVFLHVVTFSIF